MLPAAKPASRLAFYLPLSRLATKLQQVRFVAAAIKVVTQRSSSTLHCVTTLMTASKETIRFPHRQDHPAHPPLVHKISEISGFPPFTFESLAICVTWGLQYRKGSFPTLSRLEPLFVHILILIKLCFHFIKLKHCLKNVAFGKRFPPFVLFIDRSFSYFLDPVLIACIEERNPPRAVSLDHECQKVLCFSLLRHLIGFDKPRHLFIQSEVRLKPTVTVRTFSRA